MTEVDLSKFNPPTGCKWLAERQLVGFEPFTALQPWQHAR